MSSIRFKNVTKSFGAKEVIRDIDIAVDDGEFLVLLGPSGCGKSTLLRMLAGLESISGGEIVVSERRVDQLPPGQRDMAFVYAGGAGIDQRRRNRRRRATGRPIAAWPA